MKIYNKTIVNLLRYYEQHMGLFIHKYAMVIGRWHTIPSAHLLLYSLPLATTTLHPTPLPIDPILLSVSLLYSLQLYLIPHRSLCPLLYTSYTSPADAMQVPTLVYDYKIEKERAITRCLFFIPKDLYGGSCNPVHRQSSTSQLAWTCYIIISNYVSLSKTLFIKFTEDTVLFFFSYSS